MVFTRNTAAKTRSCGICANQKSVYDFPTTTPTSACLHEVTTCIDCLQRWIFICMNNNYQPSGAVTCPDCDEAMLAQIDLQGIVPLRVRQRLARIFARVTRSMNPAWRWCLNPTCDAGQPHETYDPQLWPMPDVCICWACDSETCTICDRPWHEGETCEEYAHRNMGHLVAESLSQKTIKFQEANGTIKKCPQCCCPIQNDGSLKMLKVLCGRCRYKFDWDRA